jgi:hypothetical protein
MFSNLFEKISEKFGFYKPFITTSDDGKLSIEFTGEFSAKQREALKIHNSDNSITAVVENTNILRAPVLMQHFDDNRLVISRKISNIISTGKINCLNSFCATGIRGEEIGTSIGDTHQFGCGNGDKIIFTFEKK